MSDNKFGDVSIIHLGYLDCYEAAISSPSWKGMVMFRMNTPEECDEFSKLFEEISENSKSQEEFNDMVSRMEFTKDIGWHIGVGELCNE